MRSLVPFGLLYLVACDSDKSLTVQNPAPTADIISHDDGSEILEGFSITLTGLVSDSNHTPEELTTTWVVNGETVCENVIPDEGGGTSCDVVFTTDDTDITLQVKDAENKGGSDSITVVILETEEPIAEIITLRVLVSIIQTRRLPLKDLCPTQKTMRICWLLIGNPISMVC